MIRGSPPWVSTVRIRWLEKCPILLGFSHVGKAWRRGRASHPSYRQGVWGTDQTCAWRTETSVDVEKCPDAKSLAVGDVFTRSWLGVTACLADTSPELPCHLGNRRAHLTCWRAE